MLSRNIKKNFLDFFRERGHKIVSSSDLTAEDPTLLFTTAGMQQFKPYYLGEKDAKRDFGANRLISIQKCLRTSDIDEVGDDTHLTFFEMLGNFSFNGDYFKKEAIIWAKEFLEEIIQKFDKKDRKIEISVFKGDDEIPFDKESYEIAKGLGFKDEQIIRAGRKDNFWGPTGKSGPCGPTVEFYIDGTEVWNLVFNEYFCEENGQLMSLTEKGVDTGMGLERLLMIIEDKKSVFETDLLEPLISIIKRESKNLDERNARIIADHLKAAVFIAAERIQPSNKERGYVLRRLIRRAEKYRKTMSFDKKIYAEVIEAIAKIYGQDYREINLKKDKILEVIQNEILEFEATLERGLKEFEKLISTESLNGKTAFYLYETFGFPFELTKELAEEKNIKIEKKDFDKEFFSHQEISRTGAEKKFGGHGIKENSKFQIPNSKLTRLHTSTHLLQAALCQTLGPEVKQMGSDINEERTRFDYSFFRKPSPDELKKIEDLVNDAVKKNLDVVMTEMAYKEAVRTGALAFFKEKYSERVRVYSIRDKAGNIHSSEICAGPHVEKTGEVGEFKIIKEEGIGKGIRRIKGSVV